MRGYLFLSNNPSFYFLSGYPPRGGGVDELNLITCLCKKHKPIRQVACDLNIVSKEIQQCLYRANGSLRITKGSQIGRYVPHYNGMRLFITRPFQELDLDKAKAPAADGSQEGS